MWSVGCDNMSQTSMIFFRDAQSSRHAWVCVVSWIQERGRGEGGEEEAGRVQLRAFESLGRSGFSYNTLLMTTMTIIQPQKCGVETRFFFHLFYSDPIWRLEPNFLVNYRLRVCNTISVDLVLDCRSWNIKNFSIIFLCRNLAVCASSLWWVFPLPGSRTVFIIIDHNPS